MLGEQGSATVRRPIALIIALVFMVVMFPTPTPGGTLEEIEELIREATRDIEKGNKELEDGNSAKASYWFGWSQAHSKLAIRWSKSITDPEDRKKDLGFNQPVNLVGLSAVVLTNSEAASLFNLTVIDQAVEVALNDLMTSEIDLTHAIASFDIGDERFLGALDAVQIGAALDRLAEMGAFRDIAVAAIQPASQSLINLRDTLIAEGLNISFPASDLQPLLADLALNGSNALSTEFLDQLEALGSPIDFIDNVLIPMILAAEPQDSDLISDINNTIGVLDEVTASLDFTLAQNTVAVPEPSSCILGVLGLLSLGMIGWRRRRR